MGSYEKNTMEGIPNYGVLFGIRDGFLVVYTYTKKEKLGEKKKNRGNTEGILVITILLQ